MDENIITRKNNNDSLIKDVDCPVFDAEKIKDKQLIENDIVQDVVPNTPLGTQNNERENTVNRDEFVPKTIVKETISDKDVKEKDNIPKNTENNKYKELADNSDCVNNPENSEAASTKNEAQSDTADMGDGQENSTEKDSSPNSSICDTDKTEIKTSNGDNSSGNSVEIDNSSFVGNENIIGIGNNIYINIGN